jgi:hypothetical protein
MHLKKGRNSRRRFRGSGSWSLSRRRRSSRSYWRRSKGRRMRCLKRRSIIITCRRKLMTVGKSLRS